MTNPLHLLYFSPTGSTEKIAKILSSSLGEASSKHDLTDPTLQGRNFSSSDLIIAAVPVYGGRIPKLAAEALKKFRGENTPAIALAVYGNREYEDALLELTDLLDSLGFISIAASAFIAQHVFATEIGKGRPNKEDLSILENFGAKIKEKLVSDLTKVTPKGNHPYKEYNQAPIIPLTNDQCISCKLCAKKCPAQAIPMDKPNETILGKCILCARCIQICPQKLVFSLCLSKKKFSLCCNQLVTRRNNRKFFCKSFEFITKAIILRLAQLNMIVNFLKEKTLLYKAEFLFYLK